MLTRGHEQKHGAEQVRPGQDPFQIQPLVGHLPGNLVEAIRRAGVPASPSDSAGRYVCNRLFYGLLRLSEAAGEGSPRVGFLHLPPLPESVALLDNQRPSMSLETSRRAVEAALAVVAAELAGGLGGA